MMWSTVGRAGSYLAYNAKMPRPRRAEEGEGEGQTTIVVIRFGLCTTMYNVVATDDDNKNNNQNNSNSTIM